MQGKKLRLTLLAFSSLVVLFLQSCHEPQREESPAGPVTRPSWLGEPTVTGGSNQEPLIFRIRRGTRMSPGAEEYYLQTHSEEFVKGVKAFGANFFMTHLFKAFGVQAEADEIARAREFAELLHENGLRVGTYVGSTIAYETFLVEKPEAVEWLVDDYMGKPVVYGGTQYFRRRPYFAHPGYKRYIKDILRTGIQDIKTDLIHFDNPANQAVPEVFHHPRAIQEFREFLHRKYPPAELKTRIGFSNTDYLLPPRFAQPEKMQTFDDPVTQEWLDFRCQKLADHYEEMAHFIRGMNSEVAVEINPHGITGVNRAWESSVDFARLLPHVDFFWCEDGNPAGILENGVLVSNIRSYKLARAFKNNVFNGIGNSAVMAAENLAFNPHSLTRPTESLKAYVDFYLEHYDENYRDTRSVANIAILRNFPSMAFNNFSTHQSTILFEQTLLQTHIPFDLVYEPHLEDLSRYDVLVMANQESMAQKDLDLIDRFVQSGGSIVATENSTLFTEWRQRRPTFGLSHILGLSEPEQASSVVRNENGPPRGRSVYIPAVVPSIERPSSEPMKNQFWGLPQNYRELADEVIWAAGDNLPVQVEAPLTTLIELTSSTSEDLMTLHFVNYEQSSPVDNISVHMRVPDNREVASIQWHSPGGQSAELSWEMKDRFALISIPTLNVYGLASIRLE